MIKVLAIDDEPLALQQLAAYIRKIPFLELVGECQSALDAKKILEEEMIDAIFCDINMPDLNGMDFVKSLVAPPLVVFTTAYSEYAVEGFKVDAVDYLLKPFGLDDFKKAAEKVRKRYDSEHQPVAVSAPDADDALFFKTDYKVVRVPVSKITYVEGMSEYLKIHVEGEKDPVIVLLSMKKLEERLPADRFMRIHKSYIIALGQIREVARGRVSITPEVSLPIGDSYREAFNKYLDAKFLGK